MSAVFKYHLGKNNNSNAIRILLNDLLFQKKAEMTVDKDMLKHVELFESQISFINKRAIEFSDFSLSYFQEEYLSFEESLLLLVGINPDVLQNKHFKGFDLTNYNDTDYLATFMATRANDGKFLRKSFFVKDTQIKTSKFIKKTMSLGYFSRKLLKPKVANYRHNTKEYNLQIVREGLILLLAQRVRNVPASASNISSQLYKHISKNLIATNSNGDKPQIDTVRRYIGEIINSTDWAIQPESIRNQIKTKA
jgi:hypothetical protein